MGFFSPGGFTNIEMTVSILAPKAVPKSKYSWYAGILDRGVGELKFVLGGRKG
jgi:hypothetical protein